MKNFLIVVITLIFILGGFRLWDIYTDPRKDKEGYKQALREKIEWDKCFKRVNPPNPHYGGINHHLVLCYCGTSPMDRFLYGKSPYGDKYLYHHPSCEEMGYQEELENVLNKTGGY
jgi:hypothetical protein